MKSLIIHVGPHKTATTSVQFYLHSNRHLLARQGYAYPSFFPPRSCHNQLADDFRRGEIETSAYFEKVLADADQQPAIILSAEEFSVPRHMERGLRFLESRFNVRYVFVHREDRERIAASLLHRIAAGQQDLALNGIHEHARMALQFFQDQRQFFIDRQAFIVDYREVKSRGIEWFVKRSFGADIPSAAARLNVSSEHSTSVLATSRHERKQIAAFFDDLEITRIVDAGDPTSGTALSEAIKRRVVEVLDAKAPAISGSG